MKCSCGFVNKEDAKFCSKCGNVLSNGDIDNNNNSQVFNCGNCGSEVLKGSKFCPRCGQNFNNYSKNVNQKNIDNTIDSSNEIVFMVIAFIIPIFGICYYFFAKKENPNVAKKALIFGLISMFIRIVFEVFVNVIEYLF